MIVRSFATVFTVDFLFFKKRCSNKQHNYITVRNLGFLSRDRFWALNFSIRDFPGNLLIYLLISDITENYVLYSVFYVARSN